MERAQCPGKQEPLAEELRGEEGSGQKGTFGFGQK